MNRPRFGALLLLTGLIAPAQDFKDLQNKVKDFTLPNGLRFVVAERHDVPTVSFRLQVAAGSANDPAGSSGLAYLIERLWVRGTETIGSRDPATERKAVDALEEAQDRLEAERNKGANASEGKLVTLQLDVSKAMSVAQSYGASGEFSRVLQENGVTGWSSSTTPDLTEYHCTLPSNRTELWFLLESQSLLRPAFRDFYQEREEAVSELRFKVDANPQAKLFQTLATGAFSAHPYRTPTIGWPDDLAGIRLTEARHFFSRYYVPANITIAIAGDTTAEDVRRFADRYFAPIPARPLPAPIRTHEPEQAGPRVLILENAPRPLVAIGFKRPDQYDPSDPAFDIIQMILSGGHSGWLQQDLVDTKRLATTVSVRATSPAGRYPHLFTILAVPAPGHTAEETHKAVTLMLERLQNEKVDERTLARAKAQARTAVVRLLSDNSGIAQLLALFASGYGDWQKLFTSLDATQKVTADQVQVAALKYLTPTRRTSVYMLPPPPAAPAVAKGGAQ